jgi:DNA polymerase-3 subunit alpha
MSKRIKFLNKHFVHTHNHSEYSQLDGMASLEKLVMYCRELGFPAVALTDHGNVRGLPKLIKYCQATKDKKGNPILKKDGTPLPTIKPILGFEAYLSLDRHAQDNKTQPRGKAGNHHLGLVARNFEGYKNLCRLSHTAWMEGYYYTPRIDMELLQKHNKGLICTSGCPASVINANILHDRVDKARELCGIMKDLFGDNFFIELMYHGLDFEAKLVMELLKISKDMRIPTIASNDCHYIKKEHANSHATFLCMSTSDCIHNEKRMKFPFEEFYIKEAHEMGRIFGDVPEAIWNTVAFADRVDIDDIIKNLFGSFRLPAFPIPDGFKCLKDFFEDLTWKGAARIGWDKSEKHVARIQRELSDINAALEVNEYDFYTYFLLIRKIVFAAKSKGIRVGPGRGSVYASCVARCLEITSGPIDPVEKGLLWERFLGFTSKRIYLPKHFGFKKIQKGLATDISTLEEAEEEELDVGLGEEDGEFSEGPAEFV